MGDTVASDPAVPICNPLTIDDRLSEVVRQIKFESSASRLSRRRSKEEICRIPIPPCRRGPAFNLLRLPKFLRRARHLQRQSELRRLRADDRNGIFHMPLNGRQCLFDVPVHAKPRCEFRR